MNAEHDTSTRIVRSWLEAGSTAIPDRVLDSVLAELPSRRQRRPMWSPRRFLQMKPIIVLAASAAVVVLAVVLGTRFLPGDSGVGGPSNSPSPSASPSFVGGQFTFAGQPLEIDASSDGASLSGTAAGSWDGSSDAIRLECLRQFDERTWMLAGVLTESATNDRFAGDWGAVIVRDGSPQKVGITTDRVSAGDSCEEYVAAIPAVV